MGEAVEPVPAYGNHIQKIQKIGQVLAVERNPSARPARGQPRGAVQRPARFGTGPSQRGLLISLTMLPLASLSPQCILSPRWTKSTNSRLLNHNPNTCNTTRFGS